MKRRLPQVGNNLASWLKSWLILTALLIIVLVLLRGVWRLWLSNRLAEDRREESAGHMDDLVKRKIFLENKIADLKTDRGLEEELRTNFSVIRPGEKVINLLEEQTVTSTSASATNTKRWWQIF